MMDVYVPVRKQHRCASVAALRGGAWMAMRSHVGFVIGLGFDDDATSPNATDLGDDSATDQLAGDLNGGASEELGIDGGKGLSGFGRH
jgi:hypothetical protein